MQDKSSFSNTTIQISSELKDFINLLVVDVMLKNEEFNETKKKWLKKFSETEGISFDDLERNLNDFFELLSDYQKTKSEAFKRMLKLQAKQCYLTDHTFEMLISKQQAEETISIEPVIKDFSIIYDESAKFATLKWNVENASDLFLEELPNLNLIGVGSLKFSDATGNKEFTLTAINSNNGVEKKTQRKAQLIVNKEKLMNK